MTCRCFCWSESLCEHGLVWNVDPWLHCRCVVVVACLPPQRPGAVGTAESTLTRSVMPSALPWLPLLCLPWSWPKVSEHKCFMIIFLFLFFCTNWGFPGVHIITLPVCTVCFMWVATYWHSAQFSARETSVCRRAESNYWFFPFEGWE